MSDLSVDRIARSDAAFRAAIEKIGIAGEIVDAAAGANADPSHAA